MSYEWLHEKHFLLKQELWLAHAVYKDKPVQELWMAACNKNQIIQELWLAACSEQRQTCARAMDGCMLQY